MLAPRISSAFAPSTSTPEHIRCAEELGYERAWCYDSPALYSDVWVTLALAATRTSTIGLGPGVLVPNLRHPMANASALATLAELAPGRLMVGFGTGFTATGALGEDSVPWARVVAYAGAVRALLAGEEIEWEGRLLRMLHPDGFAAARPVGMTFVLAAAGPKGLAAAQAFGGGVFLGPRPVATTALDPAIALITGTVLEPGEDVTSGRVLAAAGHGAAVFLHALYRIFGHRPAALTAISGGLQWKETIDAIPADRRHLALNELHHIGVNDLDRPYLGPELLGRVAFTPEQLRERLAGLVELGVTEVAYQPAGPDIPRELAAFRAAACG